MTPYPYQIELADKAYEILAKHMLVYLAMEERTGKTLIAILVCERLKACHQNILVLTKKKALKGWQDTLQQFAHQKIYFITNYHQACKLKPSYDIVILDEAHCYISAFPKQSKMWGDVKALTKNKPILYLSATPYAQGVHLLYNQLALSTWSPFRRYSTPYSWFRRYGIPNVIYLAAGRRAEAYNTFKTQEVLVNVNPLMVRATRAGLNFEQEPTDKLHYISLGPETKRAYNILLKDKVIELQAKTLICDTSIKLRTSLHMLEGGVAKIGSTYLVLLNYEKIKYILTVWGDNPSIVIMYNYVAEKRKLEMVFKHAQLLQATSYAEGVDLSMYSDLIIYSQDFSTARHSQRRARQANKERKAPIIVHFLLVKKAISEQVYQTVSLNKRNFIDSVFEREEL